MCYFLLYGLIILVVLWVFQTFFLESFYTTTKSAQVEKNASIISKSIQENKNVQGTIENVASYNSLSVYVYDSSSTLFKLIYDCEYDNPATELNFEYHDVYSYYKSAVENGGQYMCVTNKRDRSIAQQSIDRIVSFLASPDSPRSEIHYSGNGKSNVQNMVYADIIELRDSSECFLIVTSSITPLNNTVEIIKDQMFIVSVVFIILAVFLSIYVTRRIARPISKTNSAAKELAKKNYNVEFDATGYLEVE